MSLPRAIHPTASCLVASVLVLAYGLQVKAQNDIANSWNATGRYLYDADTTYAFEFKGWKSRTVDCNETFFDKVVSGGSGEHTTLWSRVIEVTHTPLGSVDREILGSLKLNRKRACGGQGDAYSVSGAALHTAGSRAVHDVLFTPAGRKSVFSIQDLTNQLVNAFVAPHKNLAAVLDTLDLLEPEFAGRFTLEEGRFRRGPKTAKTEASGASYIVVSRRPAPLMQMPGAWRRDTIDMRYRSGSGPYQAYAGAVAPGDSAIYYELPYWITPDTWKGPFKLRTELLRGQRVEVACEALSGAALSAFEERRARLRALDEEEQAASKIRRLDAQDSTMNARLRAAGLPAFGYVALQNDQGHIWFGYHTPPAKAKGPVADTLSFVEWTQWKGSIDQGGIIRNGGIASTFSQWYSQMTPVMQKMVLGTMKGSLIRRYWHEDDGVEFVNYRIEKVVLPKRK